MTKEYTKITKDGLITIKEFSWLQFITYRISLHSLSYLLKRTSAGYPRLFSMGYYSKSKKEIVIATVFNYELRIKHEIGHANGLVHTWTIGSVMNPLGFLRGNSI